MHRLTTRLALAFWVLVAVACGSAPDRSAASGAGSSAQPAGAAGTAGEIQGAPAVPTTPDHLKLAYVSITGNTALLWLAEETGIFKKWGLEPEMRYIASGTTAMSALLAREIDLGIIAANASISAALQGADTVYIGALQRTLAFDIYARPDIQGPAALRGTRMGISRVGSTSEIGARMYLGKYGLEVGRDVTFIEVGSTPETAAALEAGAIDSGVISVPTTIVARKLGFKKLAFLGELGGEYPQGALTTTRSYIREHEDTVRRFLWALTEAVHRFKTDPELTKRVMANGFKTDDQEILDETWDRFAKDFLDTMPVTTSAGAKEILKELATSDPKAATADPASFIDARFLEELRRSGFVEKLYGGAR